MGQQGITGLRAAATLLHACNAAGVAADRACAGGTLGHLPPPHPTPLPATSTDHHPITRRPASCAQPSPAPLLPTTCVLLAHGLRLRLQLRQARIQVVLHLFPQAALAQGCEQRDGRGCKDEDAAGLLPRGRHQLDGHQACIAGWGGGWGASSPMRGPAVRRAPRQGGTGSSQGQPHWLAGCHAMLTGYKIEHGAGHDFCHKLGGLGGGGVVSALLGDLVQW